MTYPQASRHYTRGAVMAETAMVISFTLVMLFSILQLIILGYLQMAGDAATFIAAHEYTLGVPAASIKTVENGIVPASVANAVTYIPSPPPTIDASLFTQIYGNFAPGNRNGGYTLVRPQNFQVGLKNASYKGFLGFDNVGLSAGAVEGYYLMTNNQMNNAGVGPNDDQGDGSILTPLNSSPFLPQSDANIANMNTPPYYLPSPTMILCVTAWTSHTASGPACPNTQPWFLGLADYINDYNYSASFVGTGIGGTFQAMAAHQRIFQKLMPAFPVIPGGSTTVQDANLAIVHTQFLNYNNQNTGIYAGNGCTSTATCGSNWSNASILPNDNGTGVAVPLVYYDPMRWWVYQGAYPAPNWHPTTMWSNAFETSPALLGGNDGPAGPAQWSLASPGLVYYWDQPNYPPRPTAPGSYPTHPLNGATVSGEPGY